MESISCFKPGWRVERNQTYPYMLSTKHLVPFLNIFGMAWSGIKPVTYRVNALLLCQCCFRCIYSIQYHIHVDALGKGLLHVFVVQTQTLYLGTKISAQILPLVLSIRYSHNQDNIIKFYTLVLLFF